MAEDMRHLGRGEGHDGIRAKGISSCVCCRSSRRPIRWADRLRRPAHVGFRDERRRAIAANPRSGGLKPVPTTASTISSAPSRAARAEHLRLPSPCSSTPCCFGNAVQACAASPFRSAALHRAALRALRVPRSQDARGDDAVAAVVAFAAQHDDAPCFGIVDARQKRATALPGVLHQRSRSGRRPRLSAGLLQPSPLR